MVVDWRKNEKAGFVKVFLKPNVTKQIEDHIKFEINMPNIRTRSYDSGYELIAYWKHLDIVNNSFYVDSNSLELLEKEKVKGVEG
jgi:hypothetical protein